MHNPIEIIPADDIVGQALKLGKMGLPIESLIAYYGLQIQAGSVKDLCFELGASYARVEAAHAKGFLDYKISLRERAIFIANDIENPRQIFMLLALLKEIPLPRPKEEEAKQLDLFVVDVRDRRDS